MGEKGAYIETWEAQLREWSANINPVTAPALWRIGRERARTPWYDLE
jgi:hypothetical protein